MDPLLREKLGELKEAAMGANPLLSDRLTEHDTHPCAETGCGGVVRCE
jgi:hypothetical protein